MKMSVRSLMLATTALSLLVISPTVHAAEGTTAETLKALQEQVALMQKQLEDMQVKVKKAEIKSKAAEAKAEATEAKVEEQAKAVATAKPADKSAEGVQKEILPGVKVTLGGFVQTDAIYRSKNQTADSASSFNTGIPFDNSVNAHQSEFRGSARQTRLSLLAEGDPDADTKLKAFVAMDFMGAAPTANSIETNSYTPRLREAFATVDRSDWGLHALIGQSWSLLTLNKVGITQGQEFVPPTLDVQIVPGYNWTRNPQVRVVKDFADKKIWAGLSLESPQANLSGLACTVPGSSGTCSTFAAYGTNTTTTSYSSDLAPDVIGKLAFDPGWGHYEIFGITRFFHDVGGTTSFTNNTAVGAGGGVGALLPIIPKKLELQASFMAGEGIGRYGSAQLPDFAFKTDGSIEPLMQYTALFGIIGHPTPAWDIYTFVGGEKTSRLSESNNAYGYGNYGLNNSGCGTEGSTACAAQTSSVWQVTPGFWAQVYKGNYGNMKVGAQYSLTRRNAFSDSNGNAPSAYENIVFTSFRYSPF